MTAMRSIRMAPLSAVVACALAATVGVTAAHAESAWWGFTSQVRPTHLVPGKTGGEPGKDEVQELSSSAEAYFELKVEGTLIEYFEGDAQPLGGGFSEATAANVQAALEGKTTTAQGQLAVLEKAGYGPGNVVVTGGPAGEAPLLVRSVKAEAEKTVAPLEVEMFSGTGEAKVVTEGKGPKSTEQALLVTATNLGDAPLIATAADPVTIADTLPPGVEAYEVKGIQRLLGGNDEAGSWEGTVPLTCSTAAVSCTFEGVLAPYETIEMIVAVNVESKAESALTNATVTGGQTGECAEVAPGAGAFIEDMCLVRGARAAKERGSFEVTPVAGTTVPAASLPHRVEISNIETPFGVQQYEMSPEQQGGGVEQKAGGHPFQLTTTVVFNADREFLPGKAVFSPAMPKNLTFKLPRGMIGNPTAFPQCTEKQFDTEISEGVNECPAATAVGVAVVAVYEPLELGEVVVPTPVFNLVPEHGEPARFGFTAVKSPVLLDTSVRTGGDYGVTVTTHNTSQTVGYLWSEVTFWGAPGSAAHMFSRGNQCVWADTVEGYRTGACGKLTQPGGQPFLTMPTTCPSEALVSEMEGDSWAAPGLKIASQSLGEPLADGFPTMTGCNGLDFEPSIKEAVPDVKDASSPMGLSVDVHVPQEAALNPNGVAGSAVKEIKVTLPEGVTVNPGGAEGLQACSEEQIGFKEANQAAVGGFEFTPTSPSCPKQSKIATVTIHTPLLPNPLEGFVYLATPSINGEAGDNPYNSLIAMYLVAEDPVSGTLVKLPMHVELNPTTGQLVATVENPELPFEDAELHFFGGSRAPLATPALCGTYTTNAVFTPWSGNAPVDSSAQFTIDTGPNGSPCFPSPLPFAPEFQAGTTNIQAGAFTPFTTTLGHPDGDQPLAAVTMKMPPGLSGSLAGVKLCPEPQAGEGTCGAESLIGHTVVTAGLGSSPAVVARPGDVYITGPYNGHGSCKVGEPGCAPFGLSIANPAETGPFDLEKGTPCDCVVVRAKVEVDPHTAQLTVATDPLPTVLKGIPLNLQHVNVTVDRPNFMFNPTNCAKMAIAGSISGGEGAIAPISTPFQAANCATLPFKAGFSALTQAHHTRASGDSLHVVVTSSAGQANIAKIRVELPKVLPSRLTTLQKACTEAQFDSNPAGCPAGSIVGHATIHTPLVPVPLEGPAYFVSHGGAKFPELVMVLQGYGITVELSGETFISKAGVTSSTFNSIPDVPFTRSELVLAAGSNSALAANGNLCADKLVMPTTLTAQNGAVIKQSTPIAVSGCKPTIRVVRHSVKGAKATVVASVPSAGKLIVAGDGLVGGTKTLEKAGEAMIDLSLSKQRQLLLARHPDRKLKVRVHLLFEPTHGSRLSTSVTLLMR